MPTVTPTPSGSAKTFSTERTLVNRSRISSFLVVLADDVGGRAIPVWLNGPEGHSLFRGDGDHPTPSPPR